MTRYDSSRGGGGKFESNHQVADVGAGRTGVHQIAARGECAPGAKAQGFVDWGDPVLSGWQWPYVAFNGASPGPALLVTGGIHGSGALSSPSNKICNAGTTTSNRIGPSNMPPTITVAPRGSRAITVRLPGAPL